MKHTFVHGDTFYTTYNVSIYRIMWFTPIEICIYLN